jgi:hypothetical protein
MTSTKWLFVGRAISSWLLQGLEGYVAVLEMATPHWDALGYAGLRGMAIYSLC